MSTTLVECDNKPMLDGFCVAVNFFNEEVIVTRGKGFVTIQTDDDWADDWADSAYTLTRYGLEVKEK